MLYTIDMEMNNLTGLLGYGIKKSNMACIRQILGEQSNMTVVYNRYGGEQSNMTVVYNRYGGEESNMTCIQQMWGWTM